MRIKLLVVALLLPFNCLALKTIRLGTEYGGWTIPHNIIKASSICYCVGAGEDISFDLALIENYNCQVFCFDPTPRAIAHVTCVKEALRTGKPAYMNPGKFKYEFNPAQLPNLHFYPYGMWNKNETLKFYAPKNAQHVSHSAVNLQHTQKFIEVPCKRLSTIMHELGHTHIDLLKLDIEGAEYQVIPDMLAENITPTIVCVEFHATDAATKEAAIQSIIDHGYTLVCQHKNDMTFLKKTRKNQRGMQIHEYFTELFPKDSVTTEYDAYKLLKETPVDADVNYLAIPWAVLINSKKLDQVPNIKLNGGFAICQHIRYEMILPILERIGIDTLFTPHAKKSGNTVNGIKVLPFPHAAVNGTQPGEKNLLYSFIGMRNHDCRTMVFKLPKVPDAIIKKRTGWHFGTKDTARKEQEQKEYQDVLARSRFSLCPRGTGPSTLRFWESLQAGAIPVHISDECILPDGVDWQNCMIDIPESKTLGLDAVIRAVSPQREAVMRKNCIRAFQKFSGKNFVSNIHLYYKS